LALLPLPVFRGRKETNLELERKFWMLALRLEDTKGNQAASRARSVKVGSEHLPKGDGCFELELQGRTGTGWCRTSRLEIAKLNKIQLFADPIEWVQTCTIHAEVAAGKRRCIRKI
jgi:hypothetical protein